jgi:4,5-dihydroxyphthalate decarboxylase
MANPTKIRLISRAYDGVLPVLRGQVKIPGVEFEITETEDVAGMFGGMFKGRYDIGEMSLGELIYYTSRGRAEFVGIPVFPSRMFRHGFIFCRKEAAIRSPADLTGKRVGFLRWVQTAAIWMRGMLVDEYGVSASQTQWHVASMHHWDDADPDAGVEPRDGATIRMIRGPGSTGERACRALFENQLDALGVTESQLRTLLAHDSVTRLFENPREVEARYYQATRILPIMHVLALRRDLATAQPELPAQLFRQYAEAKRWARRWRRNLPSLVEAWPEAHLDEENEIFQGNDPWAYGLEANMHVLEKFLGYCHAQGISARPVSAPELFHPSTLSLTE